MAKPEVSVILTSYNSEPYLPLAIDSVRNQSMPDWELIAVDDGSRDGSQAVIRAASATDGRVRLERMERNSGGPAAPRNFGISLARGRWTAFLDSDDAWHPRKLELQLGALRREGARFISTRRRSFRADGEIRDPGPDPETIGARGHRLGHARLTLKNWICTSSVVGETDVFRRNAFPVDPKYKAVEDYWCWLKAHEELGWSWLIHDPLVYYRLAETSISRSRMDMIRKHWILYGDYFGTGALGELSRVRSMMTYSMISVLRLIAEKLFKVR